MSGIYTTLNKIRANSPCKDGWEKLLFSLNKTAADDENLAFSRIYESNGMQDALWCLRSLDKEHLPLISFFAADCAEGVLHIWEKWAKENAPAYKDAPRQAIEYARNKGAPNAADAARAAYAADAARVANAADVAYAAANAAYAARGANAAYAAYAAANAANAARAANAAYAARGAAYLIYVARAAAFAARGANAADAADAARGADVAYAAAYAAANAVNVEKKIQLRILMKCFS